MTHTVEALEALHKRLLSQAEGSDCARELFALAASVPHAAPLIESMVPQTATIMIPGQVRELLLSLTLALLTTQTSAVTRGSDHPQRCARPLL